jgi:hypothetical protein
LEVPRILFFGRRSRGAFTLEFVTVGLQPQMKTYRCPWYVSTRNHNILYFVCIPRTILLNTGLSLWKAPKTLVRRAFGPSRSAPKLMQLQPLRPFCTGKPDPLPRPALPIPSLASPPPPRKTQDQCTFAAPLCEVWTISAFFCRSKNQEAPRPILSLFCEPKGRKRQSRHS